MLFESILEKVTVFSLEIGTVDVGSFQAYSCVATPEVRETIEHSSTIGQSLAERYSPVFKVHFYIIAILIVVAVIGAVYGMLKMIRDEDYRKKKPLILQTVSVVVFIGLCIFACFTAFFRTGDINVSFVSSWLMSIFFIVFGITAGSYFGSILYFKKPVLSRIIPSIIALLTAFVMYVGELILMGGVLFRFGSGFFFEPIGICPFALIDILVIILSGLITYLILYLMRYRESKYKSKN